MTLNYFKWKSNSKFSWNSGITFSFSLHMVCYICTYCLLGLYILWFWLIYGIKYQGFYIGGNWKNPTFYYGDNVLNIECIQTECLRRGFFPGRKWNFLYGRNLVIANRKRYKVLESHVSGLTLIDYLTHRIWKGKALGETINENGLLHFEEDGFQELRKEDGLNW